MMEDPPQPPPPFFKYFFEDVYFATIFLKLLIFYYNATYTDISELLLKTCLFWVNCFVKSGHACICDIGGYVNKHLTGKDQTSLKITVL